MNEPKEDEKKEDMKIEEVEEDFDFEEEIDEEE